jgi:cardiolipin synthase
MAHRSILILPEDSATPIAAAMHAAKRSVKIKMFLFSEPQLAHAAIAARRRGVIVEVMLNMSRRNGKQENAETRKLLETARIEVKEGSPDFGLTHEKSMIVDDNWAFVQSMNWDTKNLTQTRDYAIITSHPREVTEMLTCFEADWARQTFDAGQRSSLIWCPGNGRESFARFIDKAKHSLIVQNERFQDPVILERLVHAAIRGVNVHIMTKAPHTLKKEKLLEGVSGLRLLDDVGIKIHKLGRLHGKMLLADHARAIIGSINLAPGSFDDRRELAIEVSDDTIIQRLQKTAHHDWKTSRAMDLSDRGLLADLQDRAEELYFSNSLRGHAAKWQN